MRSPRQNAATTKASAPTLRERHLAERSYLSVIVSIPGKQRNSFDSAFGDPRLRGSVRRRAKFYSPVQSCLAASQSSRKALRLLLLTKFRFKRSKTALSSCLLLAKWPWPKGYT